MTENTNTAAAPAASSSSIWSVLTADGKAAFAGLESFLSQVFASTVSAVLPTAVQTATAELAAVASGDTKDTGHILATGVKNAESAAIQVGVQATAAELSVIGGAATHAAAAPATA